MFFVVFISLFRPVPARWFHLVRVVLALDKWLQIFSPLMGCGSPFGGFVSPFEGFVGFCIWVCFIFFAEITVANGYWWIWLWVHNREKRKIEVLGFENLVMGSQSQSHHSHIKHLASLNSSPNRPCMLVSFFFFFLVRFNTYPLFNFLSLFGFQENKREKNIGYCSLCCLSFILLLKVETSDLFSIGKEKEIMGFVIYVVEVLVKMRDLLKVEPNGCLRI